MYGTVALPEPNTSFTADMLGLSQCCRVAVQHCNHLYCDYRRKHFTNLMLMTHSEETCTRPGPQGKSFETACTLPLSCHSTNSAIALKENVLSHDTVQQLRLALCYISNSHNTQANTQTDNKV